VAGTAPNERIEALLRLGAERERRLLKQERRAEREVARLRAKLDEAEEAFAAARRRVEERRAAVAEAEAALRRRQAERAAGPVYDGDRSSESAPAGGETGSG
jgi:septal ring factor EnvC (AmiA/AmiB activator)